MASKQKTAAATAEHENVAQFTGQNKRFKVKRMVVLPLLKLEPELTYYVRIDAPFYKGKEVPGSDMGPPTMTRVTDLETGEAYEMIVGDVLRGKIEEDYPESSYIGKGFAILRDPPKGARRYNLYNIAEVELVETPE